MDWNPTFKEQMNIYGVTVWLCRFYWAQTKGRVESGVKNGRRNALVGRPCRDLDELTEWLLAWAVRIAAQRLNSTTHERPAERFERSEREVLLPVAARPPAMRERVETRVGLRDGLVAVEANRYPVPLEWAGWTVEVSIQAEAPFFRRERAELVEQPRLAGKH